MTEESSPLCKTATVWLLPFQPSFCPCQSSLWVRSWKQPHSPFPRTPRSRRTGPILLTPFPATPRAAPMSPHARKDRSMQCSLICWNKHVEQGLAPFAHQPRQLDTSRASLLPMPSASAARVKNAPLLPGQRHSCNESLTRMISRAGNSQNPSIGAVSSLNPISEGSVKPFLTQSSH